MIGASIDRLMRLEYPLDRLRIYVVDDASTDATPQVIQAKAAEYPGSVFHLRREKGGEGKAATLNHGLGIILADDWMQAILIMDADVIYEASSLRKMTRHLADPEVGSVMAYIKEGSQPGNYMTRFIGYEYITAQAAARRSQEVIGVIACLAGGAQLHSRENIEAVGGRIDTTTLAEDTVTTFRTQRAGRKVIFEPHATVWAEEPGSIVGLWKQRLRWARGNIQVTRMFRDVWFRHQPATGSAASASACSGSACCCCRGSWSLARRRWSRCTSSTTARLDRLPRALADQRDHLRLHHVVRPAHRPGDRAAHVASRRCCSPAPSTC